MSRTTVWDQHPAVRACFRSIGSSRSPPTLPSPCGRSRASERAFGSVVFGGPGEKVPARGRVCQDVRPVAQVKVADVGEEDGNAGPSDRCCCLLYTSDAADE